MRDGYHGSTPNVQLSTDPLSAFPLSSGSSYPSSITTSTTTTSSVPDGAMDIVDVFDPPAPLPVSGIFYPQFFLKHKY